MSTYRTTAEITEQHVTTARTDAMDPSELTDADLKNLSTDRLRELMNAGHLQHLGIGAPRHPRA